MNELSDRIGLLAVALLLCSVMGSCESDDADAPVDAGTDEPKTITALIVASDGNAGALATVTLSDLVVTPNILPTHSEAACRFDPITGQAFIVTGLGSDAVTIVDPTTWQVAGTYSAGPSADPRDIAVVSAERAYITRLNEPSLLAAHPTSGQTLATIDLSPYADADGRPESTGIVHQDGKIYVLLQRLTALNPSDHSSLLVIDGPTGAIENEVFLSVVNPRGVLRYSDAVNALVISEAGNFGELDGGIEYFHPSTGAVSNIAVSEIALGGDVTEAVIASTTKGYAIVGVDVTATKVVSFNPSTGQKTGDLLVSNQWAHVSLELTPDNTQLWVSDRSSAAPGIHIFDTQTDQQLTSVPIPVGYPPLQVCFTVI